MMLPFGYIVKSLSLPKIVGMEQKSLQIIFNGQTHQIDSNTLVNILIHYNAVIMEVNKEYGSGEKAINIKVNALKEGSFIIDLSVVSGMIAALFSAGTVGYIADIVTITQGVFNAYKKLKGRPAKTDEDKGSITINNTNVTINRTIVKVYNQPLIREAISKSVETANSDANVEGVEISSEGNEDFVISRDEFEDLIYDDFASEDDLPDEQIKEVDDAVLSIKSLSFQRGSTWQFLYQGFQIKMPVKDDVLMDIINKGARFGKGDAIRVKLRIVQRYNKEFHAYENKSYKILAFYEHIKASYDTPELFQ